MKKYLSLICLILVTMSIILLHEDGYYVRSTGNGVESTLIEKHIVVIDVGHGGFDPGKVGVNGELEKDINLSIALKLKKFLELNDCEVILTRETDTGLYNASDSNKKKGDMKKRVQIIEEASPDIAISIHQNSFTQESSKGAQVFYHISSKEGQKLAEILQEQLKVSLKDGNHRMAKSNDSYYMLKQSNCPLVIVECGFLSNYGEAKLLSEDTYQEKIAWAIHLGVMNYLYNHKN